MIYKDVVGYEGLYEVSTHGIVRSVDRRVALRGNLMQLKKGKALKPAKDKLGYLNCALSKFNKLKSFKVHRLVAIAFLPNPYNLPEVNHLDCNKLNNHVSNLEWCDRLHNMRHAFKNNLVPKLSRDKHGKSVVKTKDFDSIKEFRNSGVPVASIAKMYNCSVDVIYRVTKK